jgi:hypothetical protein
MHEEGLLDVAGCTDPSACNYDATATEEDGSCDYSCIPVFTSPADANPASQSGVSSYTLLDRSCPGTSITHCIDVSSSGTTHTIVNYTNSNGSIVIEPNNGDGLPCFTYTALSDFAGLDVVTFLVQNDLGISSTINIGIFVVGPIDYFSSSAQVVYGGSTAIITPPANDPNAPGQWVITSGSATIELPTQSTTQISNLSTGATWLSWNQQYPCGTIFHRLILYVIEDPLNTVNEFIQFEGEEHAVIGTCNDDPLPYMTISDNCAAEPTVSMLTDTTSTEFCRLNTVGLGNNPCDYPSAWSFGMFAMPFSEKFYEAVDLGFRYAENGQIHVYGTVASVVNANAKLYLDIWLYDEMNWDEWSNQTNPTGYKADCNGLPSNHINWSYYKVGFGQAIGKGDLQGTLITLDHAPTSYFYGMQLGVGANNYSPGYGLGGWLGYSGYFTNAASGFSGNVSGNSDIAAEITCCTSPKLRVNYDVADDCGHNATFIQTIEIRDASCGFDCSGCTDTVACNFNPEANADDGSCFYTPIIPTSAGPDIDLCGVNNAQLNAINPDPLAVGYWTVVSGTGTIANPNSPSTTISNLQLGSNLVMWHQDYSCANKFDLIEINLYQGELIVADASTCIEGDTLYLCNQNLTTFCGNDPLNSGTGTWEILSGTGTIMNVNNPLASVLNLGVGLNIFEWTIDNGTCPGEASSDTLYIYVGSGSCTYGCTDDLACNYDADASFNNGTCNYSCLGCTDTAACNYNALATIDNGTCQFESCFGCTDLQATNYNALAIVNEGCLYNSEIVVFHDVNGDGIQQLDEQGIQNWPLFISALNATVFTNEFGMIDLTLPASPYIVELINNSVNWTNTTPLIQSIVLPNSPGALFGLEIAGTAAFAVNGPYDGYWDIIHCINGYEAGVHIANTGSVTLHGQLTLNCDPSFLPEADVYSTIAPDVTIAGHAEWNITNFGVGFVDLFSFHIDGPGMGNLGNEYIFNFHLLLYDENDQLVYDDSWDTSPVIGCSFDPNDISAKPVGYAEPHYILPGERIEYRIRFQNLGNTVAENILIHDLIDESVFDLTTYEQLYASATFTGCLHDDGMLDFMFNEINLPSSNTDEEGSHGFVVYAIRARENLLPGTVLYNEAFIIFDENEPVQTNEVFHTIFDCDGFTGIQPNEDICDGESIQLDATQQSVEQYTWILDEQIVSNESTMSADGLLPGVHVIVLELSNPLCSFTSQEEIEVVALPEILAGEDVTICYGNSITLNAASESPIIWDNGITNGSSYIPTQSETLTAKATNELGCESTDALNVTVNALPGVIILQNGYELTAPSGENWQWYYNGIPIEGATSQNLTMVQSGQYYVVTTSVGDCSAQSEVVNFVGVSESNPASILVYPNPVIDVMTVILPDGNFSINIYNSTGQLSNNFINCQGNYVIPRKDMASGIYQMEITDAKGFKTKFKLVLS